jgi:hypothetical protein
MITTTHEYAWFNGEALSSGGAAAAGWRYCYGHRAHVLTTGTYRAVIWHRDVDELVIDEISSGDVRLGKVYSAADYGAQPFDDAAAWLGAHV